jgi:hypothetical protein
VLDCLAADIDRAASSMTEVNDYERLVSFALRHQVVGEVASFTKRAQIDLPEAIRAGLDDYALRLRHRSQLLGRESVAIAETLDRLGVPALVAKGAVWDKLYRDMDAPRTISDLDLYINTGDIRTAVERIVEACRGVSYSPVIETIRHLHHHGFWAPDAGTAIEVHWDLAGPWHNLRFDLPLAISRSRSVSLEGGEVRTLQADDAILFCALELAKDSWSSLKKLLDFAAAVRNGGVPALGNAEIAARGFGCSRMLHASLALALELGFLRHTELGDVEVSTNPAASKVAAVVLRRLARDGERPSLHRRAIEGITFSLKHDRSLDRAYHVWRIIILRRVLGWLGNQYA